MAPILIDQRRLISLILLLALGMCALFFSGYFIGFHKAEVFNDKRPQTLALSLPDAAITTVDMDEHAYLPEKPEPGLDRDVDAPDSEPQLAATEQAAGLADNQAVSDTLVSATAEEIVAAPSVDEVQTQSVAVGGPLASEEDELALLADTAEEELARYSIQVGLFSTSDNAERKVEDLLAQRLSAYSTEYTSKNNRQMYNVRFGYYASYGDAKTALAIYRRELAGDGYIIKLKK